MKSHFKFVCGICLAVFLLFQFGGIARGEELSTPDSDSDPASVQVVDMDEFAESAVPEETAPPLSARESLLVSEALAGYRFFNVDGNGGRAAEYEYLRSNPMLFGLLNYLELDNKFILEGNFLNDRDYYGDLTYDHKGEYRLQLWTESLFHNLDHERLFSPGFTTAGGVPYSAVDRNPADSYGLRVEQDLAQFRYKLPRYPLHLNLGYWRMVREGSMQQRFADQAFEGGPNTIFSKTRNVDRMTHEGKIGFDLHLGLVDLIYDFKIRQFGDHNGTPRDSFVARGGAGLSTPHLEGVLPHDETPDSRFYAHTVKLHTSLSGGIVGAASYTYGKRENLSSLNGIQGADQTSNTIHNVAGDFTYTPCGFFTMALKYRRQEIDRDAPDSLTTTIPAYAANPTFGVRPTIDTVTDTVTATLSYLPIRLLTIKGEYKGQFLSRDNLDGWNRPGVTASMILPDHVDVHTGTLTLLSRPVKGLRMKAQYSYSTADNAMFGNAFEQKHYGSVLVTYNSPKNWGATANARIIRESSDHLTISTLDLTPPISFATFQLPRERKVDNATLSFWFVPFRDLIISGSYGLLHNSADQGVLFAGMRAGTLAPTDYTSQAQVYSLSAVYRLAEKLDLSLALQQVRSFSHFTPLDVDFGTNGSTANIQRISQTRTVESSLSARAEYRLTKNFSCALDYSYQDYDEKLQSLANGTVQSVSAYMRAKW